jgi:hypothetical protein
MARRHHCSARAGIYRRIRSLSGDCHSAWIDHNQQIAHYLNVPAFDFQSRRLKLSRRRLDLTRLANMIGRSRRGAKDFVFVIDIATSTGISTSGWRESLPTVLINYTPNVKKPAPKQ